jgi:HK97 family phage prohead protease
MNLRTERAEEVRHVEFRASDESDGQTLEGYAVVFDAWTDIRDASGTYKERIAPGATKRSLGQRTPVLQFDHGQHPLIGSIPLGTLKVVREDRNGVFVKARLSDNWLIQPVRDAIRDKAITGMSFRFRVVKDEWGRDDDGNDTRTIQEVELLELGPVVFPAYSQTSVSMRSLVGALDEDTRAELVRELTTPPEDEIVVERAEDTSGTSTVAVELADDDGPVEPPVVSHEDNRNRIAGAIARFRRANPSKETTDVDS